MPWRLIYSRRATRELDDLPARDRGAIHDRLGRLVADPGSVDLTKLAGSENSWRLRVGQWRAILQLNTSTGVIYVERVLNRREAYR